MVATQHQDSRIHSGLLAAAAIAGAALDAMVQERLVAGTPAQDPFRGLHLEASDVEQLLAGSPFVRYAQHETPQRPRFAPSPDVDDSPLGIARRRLGLSLFETSVLALCLLPEIDGRYGPLIGFLHDDVTRKQPSVELALALFAPDGPSYLEHLHVFTGSAPLRLWQLLQAPQEDALIRQPLQLDRAFLWFLLGEERLDPGLADVARILPPDHVARVAPPHTLERLVAGTGGTPVLLYGEDQQACVGAVAAAAERAGRALLMIDGAALAEKGAGVEVLQRCLREATLKGLLPCIGGASALLQHASLLAEPCRQRCLDCPVPVVLIDGSGDGAVAYAGSGVVPIEVLAPGAGARLAHWHASTASRGIAVDEPILLALAETTGMSGNHIDEVVAVAQVTAEAEGEAAGGRYVQQAARSILRQRARSLALVAPRFDWDDIILPPDRLQMLRHLCSRVRYRSQVRHEWGMGRGTLPGVTALFAGEPGTGKSMAAEVIAADLGLDMCKIDLAQVVSKYIGETEKNLARIFDEAEECGVVLVFDEADALFGKRSAVRDSHDRYANLEISYLLQRMERYRGLAVLTTNLRANLDDAFTRRIGVSVDFPLPGVEDRLRIWQRALAQAPCDPALRLDDLAERVELAGGVIVNVAVAAAHIAAEEKGAIDGDRLLRAMRWELQKMGRLMDSDALDALTPVAVETGYGSPNGRYGH